jgi:hypothetical protein
MKVIIYRRKDASNACCAVPAGEPFPAFLNRADWREERETFDPRSPPSGFNHPAAQEALATMGFYLFHCLPEEHVS